MEVVIIRIKADDKKNYLDVCHYFTEKKEYFTSFVLAVNNKNDTN